MKHAFVMTAESRCSRMLLMKNVDNLLVKCFCRTLTYYEKWARSLAVILKERGTINQTDIDSAAGYDDAAGQPAVRYTISPVHVLKMPESIHTAEGLCIS